MNSTNFCYWLQGYCEICGQLPTPQQWAIIKDHLNLVLGKSATIKPLNFCNKTDNKSKPKSSCSCGLTEEEQKDCAICKIPIC